METKRELLEEMGYENAVVFSNPSYDSAIIGVSAADDRVVYDYEEMVKYLMVHDDMTYEDAVEFIDFNTIRAIPYFAGAPIVVNRFDEFDDLLEETKGELNIKAVHENLVNWIKDWFDLNGPECNAVIGMSGGKDSTIAAKLCVEALGADRVIGIAMPDRGQGLNDADKICASLGIRFIVAPIGLACDGIRDLSVSDDNKAMSGMWSAQAEQNLPPRIRMAMLYMFAQTYKGRVVNTCNLSEDYLGYSSIWGDSVGDFSPLGKLTVTELYALGDELGLPHEWVHKTPDDGLPHSAPDEEKFGFSYEALDRYIRDGVCEHDVIRTKIDSMHAKSQFKRNAIKLPTFNPWQ